MDHRFRPLLSRKQKIKWPSPELSITGKSLGEKSGYHIWETSGPAREAFEKISPEIRHILASSHEPIINHSLVFFDIFMIGKTKESAKPHIMFYGKKAKPRIKAMSLIQKSDVLSEYPGLEVGHWDYPPHIKDPRPLSDHVSFPSRCSPSSHLPQPLDGHSLGTDITPGVFPSPPRKNVSYETQKLFTDHKESRTTARVRISDGINRHEATIGCTFHDKGKRYYMLPAHALIESQMSSSTDLLDSDEDAECHFGGFSDTETIDDEDVKITSRGSRSPEANDGHSEISSLLGSESITPSISSPFSADSMMDDSFEDNASALIQAEHSAAEHSTDLPPKLIVSSQGIHALSFDLDYVLLDEDLLSKPLPELPALSDETTATIESGRTHVEAVTGASGKITGIMSDKHCYVQFPGSKTYQEVYIVQFNSAIAPGDSGSLVQDAVTKKLYGNIVAGSVESRIAYLVPATNVLKDLRRKLSLGNLERVLPASHFSMNSSSTFEIMKVWTTPMENDTTLRHSMEEIVTYMEAVHKNAIVSVESRERPCGEAKYPGLGCNSLDPTALPTDCSHSTVIGGNRGMEDSTAVRNSFLKVGCTLIPISRASANSLDEDHQDGNDDYPNKRQEQNPSTNSADSSEAKMVACFPSLGTYHQSFASQELSTGQAFRDNSTCRNLFPLFDNKSHLFTFPEIRRRQYPWPMPLHNHPSAIDADRADNHSDDTLSPSDLTRYRDCQIPGSQFCEFNSKMANRFTNSTTFPSPFPTPISQLTRISSPCWELQSSATLIPSDAPSVNSCLDFISARDMGEDNNPLINIPDFREGNPGSTLVGSEHGFDKLDFSEVPNILEPVIDESNNNSPTSRRRRQLKVKKFTCTICRSPFVYAKDLRRHNQSVHEGTKHRCDICRRGMSRKDSLLRHIQNVHPRQSAVNLTNG